MEEKLEIHKLFDKYHQKQQRRLRIYDKIYNKIMHKIKNVSNKGESIFSTYYVIPEYLFGSPLYNQTTCITYCIIKLRKIGFEVTYTHPNFIYISWQKFINSYKYQIQPMTSNYNFHSNERKVVTKPNKIKSFFKNLNDQLINENDRAERANNQHDILNNIQNRANLINKFDF
jgi:hypothetical protein